jgi:hypothetical protein
MASHQKAKLIELDEKLESPKSDGKNIDVQFNPETLKVTYSNKIAEKAEGGSKDNSAGPGGRQYVGSGTTKLSLQLWFEASSPDKDGNHTNDVRHLTKDVVYFMTPQNYKGDKTKKLPPGIRFAWGTFIFDGVVDTLDETLEYFSRDGNPLRSSISLGISQEKILIPANEGVVIPGIKKAAGTSPVASAKAGDSLQSLAAANGKAGNWQAIAAANGIENPRSLAVGQLLDLNIAMKR